MTKRIRAAFVGSLENADWMDWGTREAAREKVTPLRSPLSSHGGIFCIGVVIPTHSIKRREKS